MAVLGGLELVSKENTIVEDEIQSHYLDVAGNNANGRRYNKVLSVEISGYRASD
jgi:hypothetical protein